MPILKKWQVLEFKKYTQAIKSSKSNHILNYICITPEGKLIKTDLETTCMMGVDFALKQLDLFGANSDKTKNIYKKIMNADFSLEENLLVDEKILYAITNSSSNEYIYVWNEKVIGSDKKERFEINISDAKNLSVHPFEDASVYPKIIQYDGEVDVYLDRGVITAMQIARKFTQSDTANDFSALHIYGKYIMAYNFHSFFFKELNVELPNIILVDKHANAISQFDSLAFYNAEKHYYFVSKERDVLYMFTKTQYRTPDLIGQIKMLKQKMEENPARFFISRDEFLNFCNLVSLSTEKTVTPCILTPEKTLRFEGNDACKEIVSDIFCEGDPSEFNFNSQLIRPGMEVIKESKLNCSVIQNMFIVENKEDNGLTVVCFVGGQKQTQSEIQEDE